MGLKETYESWAFRPLKDVNSDGTPRNQSEGKFSVDFLPNTYQKEVRNRTPGDKTVTQAATDDATYGTFNTTSAFKYYSTLFKGPLRSFRSKIVHLYDAQGNDNSKYVTSNDIRNTPGALYNTNR